MRVSELIGLLLLGFMLGAHLMVRPLLVRRRREIAIGAGIAIALTVAWLALQQYLAWREHPLSRFFLPPYVSAWYFALYAGKKFLLSWVVAAAAGWIGYDIAKRLNLRFGGRFFEEEEPFLFGMGIFLAGYPAFMLYVALMCAGGVLCSLIYAILKKGRAPLYHLWLPLAVFAILITHVGTDSVTVGKFIF